MEDGHSEENKPAGLVDGTKDLFQVEDVLGHKRKQSKVFYKIKWLGYNEAQWVVEKDVSDDVVKWYWERKGGKPRRMQRKGYPSGKRRAPPRSHTAVLRTWPAGSAAALSSTSSAYVLSFTRYAVALSSTASARKDRVRYAIQDAH